MYLAAAGWYNMLREEMAMIEAENINLVEE